MDNPLVDVVENPVKKTANKRNPVSVELGKRLKKLRIAVNKSQETVAFEAGIDRTYISTLERGIANPSVLALANICFSLNITLAKLFEPLDISLAPDGEFVRRTNQAEPQPKAAKSRLR